MLALACFACAHTGTIASPGDLVGTWRLVEYWNRDSVDQSKQYPYGEQPLGFIVYDRAGNVLVELARNPQPHRLSKEELDRLTVEELHSMLREFVAYFGTYTVDTQKGLVIHHVTADLRREYTDTDQARPFQVVGDTLTIGDSRTWLRRFVRVK
jgi:hypothetical protein